MGRSGPADFAVSTVMVTGKDVDGAGGTAAGAGVAVEDAAGCALRWDSAAITASASAAGPNEQCEEKGERVVGNT